MQIVIRNMESETLPGDFEVPPGRRDETCIAFNIRRHPHSSAFALPGLFGQNCVPGVWDTNTGKLLWLPEHATDIGWSLDGTIVDYFIDGPMFSPDERFIVTLGSTRYIWWTDRDEDEEEWQLPSPGGPRTVGWVHVHDIQSGAKSRHPLVVELPRGWTPLVSATTADIPQDVIEKEMWEFFQTAKHPKLNRFYKELTYLPMVELMKYLRVNWYQTWICSGGGIDFMRVVSQDIYGIPTQQVIGSSLKKQFVEKDGIHFLTQKSELLTYNDKTMKPVNIDLHIGKRPVFAAGNVRSGGDIVMLEYCQARKELSFQLMVNHDDSEREFAYEEKGNASLNASKKYGWNVVSMKNDWKTIFAPLTTHGIDK